MSGETQHWNKGLFAQKRLYFAVNLMTYSLHVVQIDLLCFYSQMLATLLSCVGGRGLLYNILCKENL